MLLLLLAIAAVNAVLPLLQRQALEALCATTNLPSVRDWCTTPNPCTWDGVECNSGQTQTVGLSLVGSDIAGTWPDDFNLKMSHMTFVDIEYASLTGMLSNTFFDRQDGTLTSLMLKSTLLSFNIEDLSRDGRNMALQSLFVENTKVYGDFANADPLVAPALGQFRITYSSLRGAIPTDYVSQLTDLVQFRVNNNGLEGAPPAALCTLPILHTLRLDHNQFGLFDECFAHFDTAIMSDCDLRYNFNCNGQAAGTDDDDAFDGPPTFPINNFAPCLRDYPFNAHLDACGTCGGDGTACTDCNGEFHGSSTLDVCNVCDGNGESCLSCDGVAFGTEQYDECDVCGGANECLDCAGAPDGTAVYDLCGICDGDSTSCVDCNSILLGTSVLDECGVCDGDSSTCGDCAGVPNGGDDYDLCGVCGGENECVDCSDVAFGTLAYDECGVCGGDASTCGLGSLLDSQQSINTLMIVLIVVVFVLCLIGTCVAVYVISRTRRRLK